MFKKIKCYYTFHDKYVKNEVFLGEFYRNIELWGRFQVSRASAILLDKPEAEMKLSRFES